ncbi:DNA repair protein RecN [Paludibacterium purpuratum]|uniref:DNA repair protein RecN n=1 Tax=Paludibacterium purpuratum TaxID=1144873 RepID=A0A4R7AYH5_9NEIS|nr:DNA repair protein RecN [Paludibacterium purpuratum]TDR71598.1 DNA repair protein RecN (Recombination protein N) [Paludibacterium purpuratum]
MLLSLSIKDFVIVDELALDFAAGFTVLTGETGAGKSIILDALGLALGDRSEGAQIVREGCDRADICARFAIVDRPDLAAWLADNELAGDEGEILLRRIVDKSGRSKSLINGQQATLAQLKLLGDALIDIHGQHAHQSLASGDTQRTLLDAYAGAEALAREVEGAWQAWQSARRARLEAEKNAQHTQSERERLDWQISEVAALGIHPGEWETLNQTHDRLANAAELLASAHQAIDALSETDGNCLSLLAAVQNRLGKLAHLDPRLSEVQTLLASVDAELHEATHSLRDYVGHIEEDPQQLAEMAHRLDTLMSMARKYRCQPQDLPQRLEEWQRQLGELDAAADLAALSHAENELDAAYRHIADKLSATRHKAAGKLGRRVAEEMQTLAMNGARFDIALTPLGTPGSHGLEDIEYLVATNTGTRLQALGKIASGGELSRISLALQVAISQVARVPTLIFDEVDVGIGGRVAEVVGKKLQALGQHYQVLCVTHLPQVASCGDQHWQVSKETRKNQTLSRIQVLGDNERVHEVARMLGGVEITDATRHHAAEMLALNARPV